MLMSAEPASQSGQTSPFVMESLSSCLDRSITPDVSFGHLNGDVVIVWSFCRRSGAAPSAYGSPIRTDGVERVTISTAPHRPTAAGRLLTVLTYAMVITTLLPLLWLLSTAFKDRLDAFALPPKIIFSPTLKNFHSVLTQGDFLGTYINSLVVVLITTAFSLLFGVTGGYTLARTDSPSTRLMGLWIILVRMAPPMGFALPFYLMFRQLNLLDTYPALVLVYLTITLPFTTWLMAGYFQSIPIELEEAARVDGCSRIGALFRIVLPTALPGLSTAAIFSFITSWNEFFYPLVVAGRRTKPASVAIQGFISDAGVDWGQLSAAAILILAPVLLFTALTQRGLVQGLTHGAVK